MRTGLWRDIVVFLFALVTISSSKLSAQSNPASSGGSARSATCSRPATAPEASSSGASAGAGTAPVDAGQPKNVGGGVTAPVLIKQVEPQFSEDARQQHAGGTVTVNMIVDQHGVPQNVHVVRGVGMGLDENAVKAVKQYRFKPAMENGKPVAVYLNVAVKFDYFENAEEMKAAGYGPPSNPADRAHYDAELGASASASGAQASSTPEDASSDSSSSAGTTPLDAGHIKQVGGSVTGLVVVKEIQPQSSNEADQKKPEATVLVSFMVDQYGRTQNVHVIRSAGRDFDEKAVEAVKQYKLKPKVQNGKPVAVYLNVEVHFTIADKNGNVPPASSNQP